MDVLPDTILEYLQNNVSDSLSPACLRVDADGCIETWSGAIDNYALAALSKGIDVASVIPAVVGLEQVELPVVFSLVNLSASSIVNLHVLPRREHEGFYVLLLDAQEEHDSMQRYQQKANEVQLLNTRLNKVLKQLRATQTELEQKKAEAEEASRLKSRFIASMSHEFRTPLTSILGYTEMLQKGMLDARQNFSATHAISSGAQHLMSLIDNVLDQARFEAGEMELNLETIDLVAVVADIQAMFQPLARQKGLDFIVEGNEELVCWVKTDGMRLRQLMINLCNNAVKYTDEGEVRLVYHCECYGDTGQFDFVVKDTGPGIAKEEQAAIFNAFHRVKSQSDKAGAGLGLAISRQILELMGGGLSLDSELGRGSEFTLTLPVELAVESPSSVTHAAKTAADLSHKTILLAEDNEDVVEVVELFLQSADYDVIVAETGQKAFELAMQHEPALVLMDMNMPIKDGYTATQELRAEGFKQPILALTASSSPQDRQRAIEAGCNSYLLKPIAMNELLAKVMEYVKSE